MHRPPSSAAACATRTPRAAPRAAAGAPRQRTRARARRRCSWGRKAASAPASQATRARRGERCTQSHSRAGPQARPCRPRLRDRRRSPREATARAVSSQPPRARGARGTPQAASGAAACGDALLAAARAPEMPVREVSVRTDSGEPGTTVSPRPKYRPAPRAAPTRGRGGRRFLALSESSRQTGQTDRQSAAFEDEAVHPASIDFVS